MPRHFATSLVLLVLGGATAAGAADLDLARTPVRVGDPMVFHGAPRIAGKAARDTVVLLGGADRWDGRFETPDGQPNWHGWTTRDATMPGPPHWQIDTLRPVAGLRSFWCGDLFETVCEDGYGNDWEEQAVFTHVVADPEQASLVRLQASLQIDAEPGYDYVYLELARGAGWEQAGVWDGTHALVTVDETWIIQPGDYAGGAGDEIQIRVRFASDGAWSDEDCLWDTIGAVRLDDATVTVAGVVVDSEDFEDGTSDRWLPLPLGAAYGDFAHLLNGLQDLDPCRGNTSYQVNFVDDGVVHPETGGTPCITWCYGPGGFIVNSHGGLSGDEFVYLDNWVLSPPLAIPTGADQILLEYEMWLHEPLNSDSPGIFPLWHVRSTNDPDPAVLDDVPWLDRNFLYYGGPYYSRQHHLIGDLLHPEARWLQIGLRALQWGWVWGWVADNATPAPYFDNVAVKAFAYDGPAITVRDQHLPQDTFPERGDLDLVNLADNWCRFDMARNISPSVHLRNDAGDSITFDIASLAEDAVLLEPPRLHYLVRANPLFDAVRQLPPGATQNGDRIDGITDGRPSTTPEGTVIEDRWFFDLPDTGFLYPGDVVHVLVEAVENLHGDLRTSVWPADTTGYHDFADLSDYPVEAWMRCLPTVFDSNGDQPHVLFWDDSGRPDQWHWRYALAHVPLLEGGDHDVYRTRAASSGVGNGLGGRATAAVLDGYSVLIYTSGYQSYTTLSNGDFANDPSRDLQVLDAWFQQGGRRAFFSGDDLAGSLGQEGALGLAFRTDILGVQYENFDVSYSIGGQVSPLVRALPNNGVFQFETETWRLFGWCSPIRHFDAVTSIGVTERLAEFTDASGQGGVYPYAAATLNVDAQLDNRVILFPNDLVSVTDPASGPDRRVDGRTHRGIVLHDLLILGLQATLPAIPPIDVPESAPLSVRAVPNPFNPRTTIALDLPRSGRVTLRLFDVRGRLVQTLQDGELPAGRHDLIWDGTDGTGRGVAAGVYFYELKASGEERIGKLALVR